MRYLLFIVLGIFAIGLFSVPEVFAQSNSTDTTPPVVNVPDWCPNCNNPAFGNVWIWVNADGTNQFGSTGVEGAFIVNATDNGGVTSGPTCSPSATSSYWNTAPVVYGPVTEVTCTATDAAGNTGTASFTVSLFPANYTTLNNFDTTPPVVTFPGLNSIQTVIATNSTGYNFTYIAWGTDTDNGGNTASSWSMYHDHIGGSNNMSCSSASGSLFPVGTTTVTCTATDQVGNTGTGTFTVIVNLVAPTVSTITIDSLEVWEWSGNTRFEIEGHAPEGPILFLLGSDGNDDEYLITKLWQNRGGPPQDPTWYGLEGGLIPLLTQHIPEINQSTNHFIKVCTYDGEINYDNTIGGQPYGGQGGIMTAESKAMLTLCETEYFTWEEFRPYLAVVMKAGWLIVPTVVTRE